MVRLVFVRIIELFELCGYNQSIENIVRKDSISVCNSSMSSDTFVKKSTLALIGYFTFYFF